MMPVTLRQHGVTVTAEPLRNGLTRIAAAYGEHSILAFAEPGDDLADEIDRAITDAMWDVFADHSCAGNRGRCKRGGKVVRFVGERPELRCWQHR